MKYYEDCIFEPNMYFARFQTNISVVDEDTFTLAEKYKNAACLNFASHLRPGGGYKSVRFVKAAAAKKLIRTQEEDLFRRSNLPEIMDTEEVRKYYPLKPLAGLYCSCTVHLSKILDPITPFETNIITVPAVVNPNTPKKQILAEAKSKLILDIAAQNNNDVLILGAWGCGAFDNDPNVVASVFKKLLTNEFASVFREVLFAIPNKESSNYKVFESVLQ